MEKSYSCVPSKSSLTFYSKTITHFSKTNNPRFAYPDRQGRVGFFRRCEKISTPPPLTVWIFAVAISPPKTGNSAVTLGCRVTALFPYWLHKSAAKDALPMWGTARADTGRTRIQSPPRSAGRSTRRGRSTSLSAGRTAGRPE